MWEYVKGSEADFEGAPEWATHLSATSGDKRLAWEQDKRSVNGNLYQWLGSPNTRVYENITSVMFDVVAERRKVTASTPTEALITERGIRYGEFKDGAAIMQQLKDVMHSAPKWDALKPSQKEALEMIQHKIGRVLNGDPDYDDNWKDIAGYATLIVKELSK